MGWEDPLEKKMATHSSSILAWKIPLTDEPGELQSMGLQKESDMTQQLSNTPLQYSCLEKPMDRGAWWAAVHGVAKSRTRLSDFTDFSLSCIGEGNGNPLQCSCLENPRDGGACWAAVYGVAQSRTRLKRLSSSSSSKYQRMHKKRSCLLFV